MLRLNLIRRINVALHITVGCICSVRFETPNIHLTKKVDYIDELGYTTETHITYTPCYALVPTY